MEIGELRAWLKVWGREYGERVTDFEDLERDSPDVHPLAVARHFAPGNRTAVAFAARRDGSSRRAYMARDLAVCGIRVVPVAFVDAVAGTQSRTVGRGARPVTAQVVAIQAHVMRMVDDCPGYGLALQAQYGIRGATDDKARWVAQRIGKNVTPRAFRGLVEQATYVLLGRMTA